MAAALARKKARRKGLEVDIKDLMVEISGITDKDSLSGNDETKLRARNNILTDTVKELKEVNEEICAALEAESIEDDVIAARKFLRPVHEVLVIVESKLKPGSPIRSRSASNDNAGPRCKLPKLELPVFNGDILKWQEFWGMFDTSINSNHSISDIDRFNYLKRYLSGNAQETISGLTLSSENYREAIHLLKDRYGNAQVQISAHMESLLKIRKVKSMQQVDVLRKLYNDVENCVRNLKSLNVEMNTYGSLLIPLLNERIPDELRILISRKFGNEVWTLDNMLGYFNEELKAKERCATFQKSDDVRDKRPSFDSFTAANLYVQGETDFDRKCVYCRNSHSPSKCRIVTNIQSRISILRKYAKCFLCLKSGHRVNQCQSKYVCVKCGERHHISICKGKEREYTKESFSQHTSSTCNILLQTAKAKVGSLVNEKVILARILFDSGSQRSYITNKLRLKLELPSLRKEKLVIKTFGNNDSSLKELDVVQFKIYSKFVSSFIYVEALSVPVICSPLKNQNINAPHKRYQHLEGLTLADHGYGDVDTDVNILIGVDFYYSFLSGKIVRGEEGPVALESSLGWILAGCNGSSIGNSAHCFETHTMHAENEEGIKDVKGTLERFWKVESVSEVSDECVIHRFEKSIYHNGERYVTNLPFRPDHDTLPDNYEVSENRLFSLMRRFTKDDKLYKDYNEIFYDYEKQNIIEKVPFDEIAKKFGTVYYIPHHPVVRQNRETTKIRPVFDASWSINKPSLNDCLYPGPNLLSKIFTVLLKFRMNFIGILADIKQAFLNVEISPEHKDFLRFLLINEESGRVIIYRFLRLVFGITSSPFLLNGTIKHHLALCDPSDNLNRLKNDLYVDDVVSGCTTVEEGISFYEEASVIMSNAGFELRKWKTNNKELQNVFYTNENSTPQRDELSYNEFQFSDNTLNTNKVLGLEWELGSDQIIFRFDEFIKRSMELKLSKRNVLSLSASIYDPLGLITPITTVVKIIFQMLCRKKLEWDELVPKEVQEIWKKLISGLSTLGPIRINRFSFFEVGHDIINVEVHAFSDRSKQAYPCAVYI